MRPPRATMRLQFHKGFTFVDAASRVSYLADLGISHLYSSPIMTARAGSPHGYDVVDPTRVNPELGGEQEFRRLVKVLRQHEMGLITDTVPNHMAADESNPWWMDVLALGRNSRFAKFFDIDWCPAQANLQGKVLLPILGRPYGEALTAGEITLDRKDGSENFTLRYFDRRLPVAQDSVNPLSLEAYDARSADGRERLHALLERQNYRLSWWRSANDEVNYRRFFDINDLVGLRMDDDDVFEAVHATLFQFYAEGLIDGIRVDHIDGLSRPVDYCRKVRQRLSTLEQRRPPDCPSGRAYFVVEKILNRGETLPQEWETDGTTGYDFMDEISALLHAPTGEQPLRELWQAISGRPGDFAVEEELARRQILNRSFSAQLAAAAETLYQIAQGDVVTRDFSRAAIARALVEILCHFPVYRIYTRVGDASTTDRTFLKQAVEGAKSTCLLSDRYMIETLAHWLGGEPVHPRSRCLQEIALARFQQLSAPLCAKAVEDTAFYRYGLLISRNDVGFDARRFACSLAEFDEKMQARAKNQPYSMLTTATHDHKRGEDVRARLAVLSEIPEEWTRTLDRWLRQSESLQTFVDGMLAPSTGDLAFLFQTIVGAWPLDLRLENYSGMVAFSRRLSDWQQKALREAKLVSDWLSPNHPYEAAAEGFISRLFDPRTELLRDIFAFVQRIAAAGAMNSLAQVLVKLTAPGVPDIYQGGEYWDFSLVDPDNRQPVDFDRRQASLEKRKPLLADNWANGDIKQALIARALAARKKYPDLFAHGDYLPCKVSGALADCVGAFARRLGTATAITIFSRATRLLIGSDSLIAPSKEWKDTHILSSPEVSETLFSDALSDQNNGYSSAKLNIRDILSVSPVALLISA